MGDDIGPTGSREIREPAESGHETGDDGVVPHRVELIAHRAGNEIGSLHRAAAIAGTVEADVHLFRGRLEVRHEKVLWPLAVPWEPWQVVRRAEPPPRLDTIMRAVPPGTSMWLDLKGPSLRLARLARTEILGLDTVTVSSRWWFTLRAFRRRRDVRTMRSVGNRAQLAVALRLRRWTPNDGVVIHERLLTPTVATRLRRATEHLCAWAVDDRRRAIELVEMGCSGLIIDDLGLVRELGRRFEQP